VVCAEIRKQLQESPDFDILFVGVTEGLLSAHAIEIAAPDSLVAQVAGSFQIGHNPLSRPLGDPRLRGDVTSPYVWILGDDEENSGMTRKESPRTAVDVAHSSPSAGRPCYALDPTLAWGP